MVLTMNLQRRWWWVVTGIAMVNGYFIYGIIYSYGVLFGDIQAEFHSSTLATGWVQSLCLACGQIFAVPGQMLVARVGYFYAITTAVFLYTLSMLLSSFVPSAIYMYITYGLGVGIATGLATKPAMQLVFEWVPIQYRVRASTLATMGATIGLFSLSPLLGTLLTNFGWRWTLRICSGLVFTVGLLVAPLLYITPDKNRNKTNKEDDDAVDKEEEEAFSEVSQREILCFPEIWIFGLMCVIVSCAMGFTMVNLVDFTTKVGLTLEQGTMILSINGGAELAGKLVIAAFIDKLPFPKILIWPHACIASAITCVLFLYVESFEAMLILSTVLGLMKSIFNATSYVVASELVAPSYQPSVASLGSAPFGVGFLLAALVGGFSYDLTGSYNAALYACAGLFLVGCVLAMCTLLWQKTCSTDRYQPRQPRRTEQTTKDCYNKLNVIEDKLQSTDTTYV